jgi:uncharacterized protein (TIGR01777 family)
MAVIAITGASGLIGSALAKRLRVAGDTVRPFVRRAARDPLEISWDPARGRLDATALRGVDAVVHLAGESIATRWTDGRKRRIRESRVVGTSLLANALAQLDTPPRVLVSASAVGYYGDRGDELLDESSGAGTGFLAAVCVDWEAATQPAAARGIRVVHLRNGIVLARDGGALSKMLLPFRLGLGGPVGSGRQWLSWIALADVVEIIRLAIGDDRIAGPVNTVSPNPVSNADFARALGRVLHRPALLSAPAAVLRLALGAEMANETLLASQRVVPRKLASVGYVFRAPTIDGALASIIRPAPSTGR